MDIDTIVKPTFKQYVQRSKRWMVVLRNSDYVAFEAVCTACSKVFGIDDGKTYDICMTAHRYGQAPVFTGSKDIAETKAMQANNIVHEENSKYGMGEYASDVFIVKEVETE